MLKESEAHIPDILDCIANLSSDEIFTPPAVANLLLDHLPQEVWSNPELKFLDPACKTGVFLRECARRLLVGLEPVIPDETARREHIFKNMLFGLSITELTGMMSRRSLYYSKDASGENSVVKFDQPQGNISFKRSEHTYKAGKCEVCGSVYKDLERGEDYENYAYEFIHSKDVEKMKFDVIIGNPPYQIEDGGASRSASPIYHLFVNQAFRLKPRYVAMIIPSRWFAGGKGLDSFREQMLASKNFRVLADYPNASELFPSVEIKGGVCYFLWDEKYEGPCEVTTYQNGEIGSVSSRFLGEHGDVFIRFNEALPILSKIQKKAKSYVDELVGPRKPFGMPTNFTDFAKTKNKFTYEIYANGGKFLVDKRHVTANLEWVDKWKVLTSNGYGAGEGYPHQIIGVPIVAEPNSVCTETYIVCGVFDTEKEARNYETYMRTRFFRFFVALRKNTQHVTQSRFKFVPQVDLSKVWTDELLFKEFGLNKEEQQFIVDIVREMRKED